MQKKLCFFSLTIIGKQKDYNVGFPIEDIYLPAIEPWREYFEEYSLGRMKSSLQVQSGEDIVEKVADFGTSIFAMIPYIGVTSVSGLLTGVLALQKRHQAQRLRLAIDLHQRAQYNREQLVISNIVRKIQHLTENTGSPQVVFADGRLEEEYGVAIGQALKINTVVTTLSLVHMDATRALASLSIAEGLKENSTLEELAVVSFGMNDTGLTNLAEALQINTTLTVLELYDNELVTEIAFAAMGHMLRHNRSLHKLTLSGFAINDSWNGQILADGIRYNDYLSSLTLAKTNLCDAVGVELGRALAENNSLHFIDLSHNRFGISTAASLVDALEVNTTLESLILNGSFVEVENGDPILSNFSRSVRINTKLQELQLENLNVSTDSLQEFLCVCHDHNPTLACLAFSYLAPDDFSVNFDLNFLYRNESNHRMRNATLFQLLLNSSSL